MHAALLDGDARRGVKRMWRRQEDHLAEACPLLDDAVQQASTHEMPGSGPALEREMRCNCAGGKAVAEIAFRPNVLHETSTSFRTDSLL